MKLHVLSSGLCCTIFFGPFGEVAQASKRAIQPLTVSIAAANAIVIGEPAHLPVSSGDTPLQTIAVTLRQAQGLQQVKALYCRSR